VPSRSKAQARGRKQSFPGHSSNAAGVFDSARREPRPFPSLRVAAFIGAVLLLWPFRQGASWARWAIPAHGLILGLASLWGTLFVQLNTPARSPWLAAAAGIVLLAAGGLLSISTEAPTTSPPR
jgi:hypothetical protein